MTRPLPFGFSQSVARNGPYSLWHIFHTMENCLDHSRKMMREMFNWNEMLNWWLPGCNKNNAELVVAWL